MEQTLRSLERCPDAAECRIYVLGADGAPAAQDGPRYQVAASLAQVLEAGEATERSLVLLRPGTQVFPGGLAGLLACLAEEAGCGVAVPYFVSKEDYAGCDQPGEAYTPAAFAALAARVSQNLRPCIPGSGAPCLALSREGLKALGGLRETTAFTPAYQLETCFRFQEAGFACRLCESVYVEAAEDVPLTPGELGGLRRDFVLLTQRWECFDAEEEILPLRGYLAAQARIRPGRRNILCALHADFREDALNNVGGTQFHVRDLVTGIREEDNLIVTARDGQYLRVTAYSGQERVSFRFFIGKQPPFFTYRDQRLLEMYGRVLRYFQIGLVHVHHVTGLSLDIYYAAHAAGVPLVASLHDFFTICPTLNLVALDNRCCIGRETPQRCQRCLQVKCGLSGGELYLRQWRARQGAALALCSRLIAPSTAVRDIFASYFPALADRVQVIEHGSDGEELQAERQWPAARPDPRAVACFETSPTAQSPRLAGWAYLEGMESRQTRLTVVVEQQGAVCARLPLRTIQRPDLALRDPRYLYAGFQTDLPLATLPQGELRVTLMLEQGDTCAAPAASVTVQNTAPRNPGRLRVAFVGAVYPIKGSELLHEAMTTGPEDLHWFILGGIDDPKVAALERSNVVKVGWYNRRDLAYYLRLYSIDVVCILSVCPETFCFTLSEALMCGVPVLGLDIGAVGSRVRELEAGWLLPPEANAAQLLELLGRINPAGDEYKQKVRHIATLSLRTVADMVRDYRQLYQTCAADGGAFPTALDNRQMYAAFRWGEGSADGQACQYAQQRADLAEQLRAKEQELRTIYSTKGYRVLMFLRRVYLRLRGRA